MPGADDMNLPDCGPGLEERIPGNVVQENQRNRKGTKGQENRSPGHGG